MRCSSKKCHQTRRLHFLLEHLISFFLSLFLPAMPHQPELKVGSSGLLLWHSIASHSTKGAEAWISLKDVSTKLGLCQKAKYDPHCDGEEAVGQRGNLNIALHLCWPQSVPMVEVALS